jgi:hypothetical protein
MAIVDIDALIRERAQLLAEDREKHYIMSEMIEPLRGGVILGGFIHEDDSFPPFPVLSVMVKGKVYNVVISADDELNHGGRLIIEESGERLTTE